MILEWQRESNSCITEEIKMQPLDLYEEIKIRDSEFPVQINIHDVQIQGYLTKPHWHEHVEFIYVLEGEAIFGVNNQEFLAREGDFIVANSNEVHSIYCTGKPLKDIVIIFEMEQISKTLAGKSAIYSPFVERDTKIMEYMSVLCEEFEEKKPESRLMSKGLVYMLLAYLTRKYAVAMLEEKSMVKRARNLERINVVLDYIEKHYAESINNTELAQLIHVSDNHFYYLFKEIIGMAPHQYVNELRLKKAMNLLMRGQHTLPEIAEKTGFPDYNNFGRKFKEYYGYPPSKAMVRA